MAVFYAQLSRPEIILLLIKFQFVLLTALEKAVLQQQQRHHHHHKIDLHFRES